MIPRADDHARLLRLLGLATAVCILLFMPPMTRSYALPHPAAWAQLFVTALLASCVLIAVMDFVLRAVG